MKVLKNILSQLHTYVLFALLAAVFWSFIFGIITDAPVENKIVIFADAYSCEGKALDIELEKNRPDGIRIIRAHTFDYVMFDEVSLLNADIYLVPEENAADYLDSFSSFDPSVLPWDDPQIWSWEGADYGVKFDGAQSYIKFVPENMVCGDVYLFFGKNSQHTASLNGSADDAALLVAYELSQLK